MSSAVRVGAGRWTVGRMVESIGGSGGGRLSGARCLLTSSILRVGAGWWCVGYMFDSIGGDDSGRLSGARCLLTSSYRGGAGSPRLASLPCLASLACLVRLSSIVSRRPDHSESTCRRRARCASRSLGLCVLLRLHKSVMTTRRPKRPMMTPTMTAVGCVFRLLYVARAKSCEYDIVSVVDVVVAVYGLLI
jgi:hypothetical protein